MPRIILEYGNDRYAIWCRILPPPVEGGKGSIIIPNVELRHKPKKRRILIDLEKIFNRNLLLEISDFPFDESIIIEKLRSMSGRNELLMHILKLIDKDIIITKLKEYFGDEKTIDEIVDLIKKLMGSEYDYLAIPRVGVDYKVRYNEIVIELEEDPESKERLCIPLNGGNLEKELTIKLKS